GDRIYAVILGSAVNNDGAAKVSYTASSTEGQARAMAEAFAAAEVAPSSIGYVEGHGTGTVVGDPLEVEALRRCFATDPETRPGGCHLGSVKTNIGHLEQAAGVASLIKTALSIHHGRIPPSLNFETPNPRIDFAGGPFRIPTTAVDWDSPDQKRRAAVNSLGLGGTNAFAILEQAPLAPRAEIAPPPVQILALSARTEAALASTVDRWRDHLAELAPDATTDACHTAAAARAPMKYRIAVSAPDAAGLSKALVKAAGAPRRAESGRKLAFLFPGQGAQYPGMARSLHDSEPAFREAFDRIAARLRETAGIDLSDLIFARDDAAALARTEVLQPALFAVEWALAEMLRAWGLRPDAVIGHSAGAFAAAAVAGIYTPEDAADLIARRAALMGALPEGGAMVALLADEAQAARLCRGIKGVVVAALNSPGSSVVSGPEAAVAKVAARAAKQDIGARALQVSHAFHSALMQPTAAPLAAYAAERPARAPEIAFVSDMTGAVLTSAPDGQYLADHLLNPVRFAEGLSTLAALGCTDFIEVGPGAALRGFAAATLSVDQTALHGLLAATGEDWEATAATLGRLWQAGHAVDLAAFYRARGARRAAAPLYPFERTRYWLDDQPAPAEADDSGLCGAEIGLPGPERHFQARYSAAARPWLPDHRVYGHVTLPVAAAMAGLAEAGAAVAGGAVEVRNLTYEAACVLAESEERLLDFALPRDLTGAEAVISSTPAAAGPAGEWMGHIRARLAHAGVAPEAVDLTRLRRDCPQPVDSEGFYGVLDALGLNYGPGFRNVRELFLGDGAALGRIALED
ncbi:MAG TPA: acyltransferase domain-containing protein, partial [Thermohalobaculum sp.]|nr:acyltransferase domain-containing protein [Thermohalobaculum sp.]